MTKKSQPEFDIDRAYDLRAQGLSWRELGAEFKVCRHHARYLVKAEEARRAQAKWDAEMRLRCVAMNGWGLIRLEAEDPSAVYAGQRYEDAALRRPVTRIRARMVTHTPSSSPLTWV